MVSFSQNKAERLAFFLTDDLNKENDALRAEKERLKRENADLRARLKAVRKVVEPLIDWEIGENTRGEHVDPLRKVPRITDLRVKNWREE